MNTWQIGDFYSQCSLYRTHDGNPIPLCSTIGLVLYRMLRDSMPEPKKSPPSYLLSLLSKDSICCHSGVFRNSQYWWQLASRKALSSSWFQLETISFECQSNLSSDLAGFQFPLLPINTVSSLASKILAASYMVLKPYFWNSNLVGCHRKYPLFRLKFNELPSFPPWILGMALHP